MAGSQNLIKYAENLIEKGLFVTPTIDKRPLFKDWVNADQDELLNKTNLWKKANGLGLIMGRKSGIICLDIDILDTTDRLKEIKTELEAMLPPVYCGLSGNPKKPTARLFKYNEERSEKFIHIDVELLAEGNQKVIPPSIHPETKKPYKWVGHDLYNIDPDELPDLPLNVLEYLRSKNEDFKGEAKGGVSKLTSESGRCKHGSHNTISKVIFNYMKQQMNFDDMVEAALKLDDEINCDEEDVPYFRCPSRREFRSDDRTLNATKFVAEMINTNIYKKDDKDFFKEERLNGFTVKEGNKYFRQNIQLYNYLKIRNDVWYIPEMKSFQVFDGKKYNNKPEDFIKKYAQDNFKHPSCISIGEKSTFLDYSKNKQQADAKEFTLKDTGLVNLGNCVLDVKSGHTYKHDKKFRMPYLIDVPLGTDNSAPIWTELLNRVMLSRKHMILALEEFVGYAISACDYRVFNKLLILDGGGSNGKSTLIRIIQRLVGEENTSSVSLESINKERFAGFHLVNKLINFCSEEPREAFSNTGAIKKLTGGDPIMVEEKHKGAFQYHNIAKLIISYNKMPFFPDDSIGMRRRIILIPCEQNFDETPELKIKDVEKRIFASELPQILNRCLTAYRGVLERGAFTEIREGQKRVEQMIMESNPILEFINDRIEVTADKKDWVSVALIYAHFMDFMGSTKIGKKKLNKELKAVLTKKDGVAYEKNGDIRGYYGLQLTDILQVK